MKTMLTIFCSVLCIGFSLFGQNLSVEGKAAIGLSVADGRLHVLENNSTLSTTLDFPIGVFERDNRTNRPAKLEIHGFQDAAAISSYMKSTFLLYTPPLTKNLQLAAADANGKIRFHTAGWSAEATERMSINNTGKVDIGTIHSPLTPADAKVEIYTEDTEDGLYIIQNNTSNTNMKRGLFVSSIGEGPQYGIDVNSTTYTGSDNGYGIYASARGAGTGNRYGVYGYADIASGILYGVYGRIAFGSGYAGYFQGNVMVTGTFSNPSDEKLKKNIQQLDSPLSKLMALKSMQYEFDRDKYDFMNLAEGLQYGFIAQEVEKVLPELVNEETQAAFTPPPGSDLKAIPEVKFKSVNYLALIPLLTKAVQEQQAALEEKEQRITTLETELQELKSLVLQLAGQQSTSALSTPKMKRTDVVLEQNQPNPFTEQTSIHYSIPQDVQQAELQVTNLEGKVVKTIRISEKGQGVVNLEAYTLNAGQYFYSLIVDGTLVATKSMVLTK